MQGLENIRTAYGACEGRNVLLVRHQALSKADRECCPDLELLEQLIALALPIRKSLVNNDVVGSFNRQLEFSRGRAVLAYYTVRCTFLAGRLAFVALPRLAPLFEYVGGLVLLTFTLRSLHP